MAPRNPTTMQSDPPNSPPQHRQENGSGPKSRGGGTSRSDRGRASRSSRRGVDPSGEAPAHTSEAVARQARHQQYNQRRRPTNYTSSYTPPASLVAHAAKSRASKSSSSSSSRRKCSSLDRSEGDGDERRTHLKSTVPEGMKTQMEQWHHHHERLNLQQQRQQQELQQMQALKQMHQKQHKQHRQSQQQQRNSVNEQQILHQQREREQRERGIQQREAQQQRHSMHEVQLQDGHYGQTKSDRREGGHRSGSGRSIPSAVSSGRRSSQGSSGPDSERQKQDYQSSGHGRSSSSASSRHQSRGHSDTASPRSSQPHSPRPSTKHERQKSEGSDEMTEQQRIEEYAGKRAMLRLEQELADHSETNASTGEDSIKSVMDRRKLARVPQVKKSDLIIGEYLGRGNFCDVFEVTWILPEQRTLQTWSSNRTLSTYDDSEDESKGESAGNAMEASMESLALSCSNDLSLIRGEGERGLTRSASRRSVSQVTTSFHGSRRDMLAAVPGRSDPLRNSLTNSTATSLRNPNVLALKCLRPAVRAQPRKFVIGAEDLAHETALLACLDHPNIIQLYGRAEGCFSTAFQMRSKKSSSSRSREESGQGKQMSDEGYFIVLDRLMATLDNRIVEWKDECRAINGVTPSDGGPVQLPPEGTLREHLCKRLKVAYCIADALEYLHSRHCVFRDLKPANVGFDCNDCVKMFDFGFATSIAPLLLQPYEGYGPLTETCGTRRYMAPEVALKLGYGKEVDVYSFGMLLWEICALDKPFDSIQSVDEFHDTVVLCGRRPSLNIDPLWTPSLKNLMCRCWSTDPLDRPTMAQVKSLLCTVLRDMNKAMTEDQGESSGGNGAPRQQRQEQGGNFIHKWRRRVSI